MERLYPLLGTEQSLADTCRELKFVLHELHAPVTGAMHVTCADESEQECVETFQRAFANEMLPRLKYGSHPPFKLSNPGARYEWGSVHIAEDHFAAPETRDSFKILLVKIDGHVGVDQTGQGMTFGTLERYGAPSRACGAVAAALDGGTLPYVKEIEETLLSDGKNRIETLRDEARVDPRVRPLFGAVAHARLQARRVVLDIQSRPPKTPTLFLVLHGVTLNRPGTDTEILGGLYTLDRRAGSSHDEYRGLGDDPGRYEFDLVDGRVRITDDEFHATRRARDHRELARKRLRKMAPDTAKIREVIAEASKGKGGAHLSKAALKNALRLLALMDPVYGALLLLGEGLLDLRHAQRLSHADEESQRKYAEEALASAESEIEEAAHLVSAMEKGR